MGVGVLTTRRQLNGRARMVGVDYLITPNQVVVVA